MCPSLIEMGSKTAEKNSAQTNRQTNRQTDRQTDTTKIMVTWPWTNYIQLTLLSVESVTTLTEHFIIIVQHSSIDCIVSLNQSTWSLFVVQLHLHNCQKVDIHFILSTDSSSRLSRRLDRSTRSISRSTQNLNQMGYSHLHTLYSPSTLSASRSQRLHYGRPM